MDRFVVRPAGPLHGEVEISGAKNSALKLMAASLLAPGRTVLRRVPEIADVAIMAELLTSMGAVVERPAPGVLEIDVPVDLHPEAPYELVSRMRASVNVLGPLLGRLGRARVALPGGDDIGTRKLDMHFRGLQAMGAQLNVDHGVIEARAPRTALGPGLAGTTTILEFPSVGATENLLMAAVLARGTSVIDNAAREPEIADLAAFLNRMGAQVIGAGSSTITVEGVDELVPTDHEVIGDRIETGTFLMACGMAGGEVDLLGGRLDHLELVIVKLGEMGLKVSPTARGLWARADGRLAAADVATLPYPGFATDYMPLVVALLTTADGTSIITENVFDGRFGFVAELARMGADVRTEGRHAVVRGVPRLSGAPVRAGDVRAGAALVLAGLAADGETEVHEPLHVDRGYVDLAGKLAALGADVRRES
jgi:UDP-N-acetylglucosamine 1-carboxyvinyltransferase